MMSQRPSVHDFNLKKKNTTPVVGWSSTVFFTVLYISTPTKSYLMPFVADLSYHLGYPVPLG